MCGGKIKKDIPIFLQMKEYRLDIFFGGGGSAAQ